MHTTHRARRAFTLIELLTVIFIITVLIAILVPTLGGVRTSARKATTQSLLVGLNNAAAQFELDNRRKPGYFSAADIGSESNFRNGTGPGLTYLENALLDLSGVGAISSTQPDDNSDTWVVVNPVPDDTSRRIWVKADLLGADEGNYFLPDRGSLVHLDASQQPGTITSQQPADNQLPRGLPDLVDAFGTPILAWIEDTSTSTTITQQHEIVSLSRDDHPAHFYWTGNGSMLSSNSLGEKGNSMLLAPASGRSLIGKGAFDMGEAEVEGVMAALLGNPGYPDEATLRGGNGYDNVFPRKSRGDFIAHSAGPDGIYLSGKDKKAGRLIGADTLSSGTLNVRYGINFFLPDGTRRTGDNGQPVTVDFLDGFDDIVVTE
ncbi:MAG TPA: prepilin-type N-terminal cleavage/methylation domain-containing protein [Phycisphaerales bacterium]|nr:prepilin-type N-terminal cleavage/methylation domain-containing protein [Phycisphaerales bacterium]